MVNFRIYRAAFVPALATVIVLLFSLQGTPAAFPAAGTTISFDEEAAAQTARQIVDAAPVRTPGSEGDGAIADLVEKRFKEIPAGDVSEQQYGSSFDGQDVQLRNVLLTIPGESDQTIAVIAARDSARGPGAVSSASATATLLELAHELGSSTRTKTLLFASTDGGSDGATGARELAGHLSDAGHLDAAIVISQPAALNPSGAPVIATSTDDSSGPIQLIRTAEHAMSEQAQRGPDQDGPLGQLAQLALPMGLGEQGPLIADGENAIALSSAGERPLPPADDQADDISAHTLGATGRAALATVLAVDATPAAPEHGPGAYVSVGGSLVPGWSLSLLALTLLLPAAVAAMDGLARAARNGRHPSRAVRWVASLGLAPFAALLLLYALALVGIVPRPRFPFDPGRFTVGLTEVLLMVLLAVVLLRAWWDLGGWRVPTGVTRQAGPPAAGLVSALAVLLVWVANPYLALLLVPAAHAWLVCARRPRAWDPAAAAGALALSLALPVAAWLYATARLDLGAAAPWQFVLMVGDRQVPPLAAVGVCAVLGSVLALLRVSGVRERATRARPLDTFPIQARAGAADIEDGESDGGEEGSNPGGNGASRRGTGGYGRGSDIT